MRTHRLFVPLALLPICVVAGCASSDSTTSEGTDSQETAIKGGREATDQPEAVLLDTFLDGSTQFSRCSGTLVLPNLVLTAKHCVSPGLGGAVPLATISAIEVKSPYAKPGTLQTVTGRVPAALHPNLDLALVQIDPAIEFAPETPLPVVLPVPLLTLDTAVDVVIVGRRQNGVVSADALFEAGTIAEPGTTGFYVMPPDAAGHSDSGGPVFHMPGTGSTRLLAGVISTLAGPTNTSVLAQRIDADLTWFSTNVTKVRTGQALSDVTSSSDASSSGQTLTYCDTSGSHEIDCAAQAGACALVDDTTGYNCVYTGDPCGSITYNGLCNGSTLVYCDSTLQVVDCPSQGLSCTADADAGGFNCL